MLGAETEAARRAAFLAAEKEATALAAAAAERARIVASDADSLRAELSMRGILPARGTPLAELIAQRLTAPEPTPSTLQASRVRARDALAMSACHLCGKAFEGEDAHTTRGRCGGCRRLRYCGLACQKGDWPAHKPQCLAWKAEADAEIVAAGGCPIGDVKAQDAAMNKWIALGSADAVRSAAERGDIAAQYVYGSHIVSTRESLEEHKQAFAWQQRAAAGNLACAQVSLGLAHEQGQCGLPVNFSEAIRYFRLAAAQGQYDGMFSLGCCYRIGRGVPLDLVESARLFRMSAELGHVGAQSNLATYYIMGIGGLPVDYAAAMLWARRAADQGCAAAEYTIGKIFAEGLGVNHDMDAAVACFSRAAAGDNANAKDILLKLAAVGLPGAIAALRSLGIDTPLRTGGH